MFKLNSPLISIIVPVYNEEDNLGKLLPSLIDVVKSDLIKNKNWPTEILIVDDGSTDNSVEITRRIIRNQPNIHFFRHKRNRGKGAAISTALKSIKGNICIIQDADLEYHPSEISSLLKHIINGETHVVFGSRFLDIKTYNGLWFNFLGNKMLSLLGSLLIRRWVTDIMTCYKAFRCELLDSVSAKSFDVEPEIAAKLLLRRNIRYREFPISYNPRKEGKKIVKLDGFLSLWRLFKTIRTIQKEWLKNKI